MHTDVFDTVLRRGGFVRSCIAEGFMERKKLRFELLLERYFTNFGKIILTNLIFAVPSIPLMLAFYFLSEAIFGSGNAYIPFFLLCIIPIYPFYAGVVKVVRNIVRGDERFSVFSVYLSGVKENFRPFLLHGLFVSIFTIVSFFSVNLYITLLSQSWIFGVMLFFCIIVVVFVFFMTFYIPLMTVTFDLPLRYVYKNSLLMSYGEFKNNFFATLAETVLVAILLTVFLVAGNAWVLYILLLALWTLAFPSSYTFMNAFFIYDGMYRMISGEGKRRYDKDKKSAEQDKPRPKAPVIEDDDFSSVDISKLKDTDDYIFFNGKMVKQSTLLRMAREKNQQSKEEDHDE